MIKYKKVWFCTVTAVTGINITWQSDFVVFVYASRRELSALSLYATVSKSNYTLPDSNSALAGIRTTHFQF